MIFLEAIPVMYNGAITYAVSYQTREDLQVKVKTIRWSDIVAFLDQIYNIQGNKIAIPNEDDTLDYTVEWVEIHQFVEEMYEVIIRQMLKE